MYRELLFSLFLSSLFHGLVITSPFFERASDWEEGFVAKQTVNQPTFTATLHQPAGESQAAPVPHLPNPQKQKLGPRTSGLSKEKGNEGSSATIPTLGLTPFRDVTYYRANELTVRPQPSGEPRLDPEEIVDIVASGKILLALWINEQGVVVNILVVRSNLADPFSQVAVNAFRSLAFTPGELNGQKVGTVMQIEVSYDDNRVSAP